MIPVERRQEIAILASVKKPNTKKKLHSLDHVAEMMEVSRATVARYQVRRKMGESLQDRPRSGRPQALTEQNRIEIKSHIKKHPFTTCAELIRLFDLDCSEVTVSRFLNSIGLRSFRPAMKSRLSASQRRNRLQWAREVEDWDRSMWRRVLFTDETIIDLSSGPNTTRVRRKAGSRYAIRHIINSGKGFRGGKSIMFWGGISFNKQTALYSFQERITARIYSDFLENTDFPDIKRLMPRGFIFMDDNAAVHRARFVENMKEANGIRSLDWWPACSADLNPIENLWSIVKEKVRKRFPNARNLRALAIQEWNTIDFQTINSLIDSMPERIRMLIKKKGNTIKY